MKKNTFYMQDSYRTGDTQPPSSHRWLTTGLLVLMIFFVGLCTGLSLLNIRLFQQETPTTLTYASGSAQTDPALEPDLYGGEVAKISQFGISGQNISAFSRYYYNLPSGIYITAVDESNPHSSSFFPGDILIACQDEYIVSHSQLAALFQSLWNANEACWTTDSVSVDIYRQGRIHRFYIPLGGHL